MLYQGALKLANDRSTLVTLLKEPATFALNAISQTKQINPLITSYSLFPLIYLKNRQVIYLFDLFLRIFLDIIFEKMKI